MRLAQYLCAGLILSSGSATVRAEELEFIKVSADKQTFSLSESGKPFAPWGFNYDHDETGRLIEDYWDAEWAKVEQDFAEMRELGANVVRVHLQLGKFMKTADEPQEKSLAQLGRLVKLAEKTGLYLDVTGLGCYHKKDVPVWYDRLSRAERWEVQARFWEAVAKTCADSPTIFCYDLMNEPVISGGPAKTDWLGPAFGDKHFVQYVVLDHQQRERSDWAREWIERLVAAVRKHDRRHLVTVGMVDWSLNRPGLTSGFVPEQVADKLDFISVHIYPESGKLDAALETLKGFSIGKPVVVEETFSLKCSTKELGEFMDRSQGKSTGWIGFYWGQTEEECRRAGQIREAIVAEWLKFFRARAHAPRPS